VNRPAVSRLPRVRKLGVPLVAIASVMLLSSCALSLQSLPKISSVGSDTYALHAVFANVLNLPDDAQVRNGAEVIGQVSDISTKNFEADLTLDIKKAVQIPVGTTAQVRFDNPLGDEYVALESPSSISVGSSTGSAGPYLKPGALIPETLTSTAPSVEDTFGALSLVLNGGGINQLQVIIHELNNTFDGNQPQIRSFLGTIDSGLNSLASGRVAIDNALTSIEGLTRKLNGGRNTIANGINSLAPAVGVLASENGQIQSLIGELSDLGSIGTRVAEQSGQDSVNDVKALLPVVQQLQSVSQQLGPDLSTLARFEAETPKIAPGDYLQVNVIANVLLPAGAFEPTPLPAESPATSTRSHVSQTQAVSDLLEAGLL
jgi:phospholipid/cholesterol/gamma-HCH transport system substrate-binding protein